MVLIDGNAVMHRAFHALPPLTNRSGELLNAVYGFSTMLFKVVNDLNPSYLIVAFDTPETTFRKREYIGYQSKRPSMDEGLSGQFPYAQKVVEAMGIPIFQKGGFEADDVIGTIAKQAMQKTEIDEVIIVTGDRDLYQLINDKVKVYAPVKGLSESKMMGDLEVKEKMGILPSQIVDYKGLTGDGSDNYPGVPGIGPKTATALLEKYGSFENVYKNLKEVEVEFGKNIWEKLSKGEELGRLSYRLATIVKDVDLDINWEKCGFIFTQEEKENTISVMKKYGFKSLVARLGGEDSEKQQKTKKEKKDDGQLGLL